MRVLSISTDKKLFENKSAVLLRNIAYAKRMNELHVVVFSLKKLGLKSFSVDNLHVYPTNSPCRLSYIFDAYRIGKNIILNFKTKPRSELDSTTGVQNLSDDVVVTCQDPFETGLVGYFLKKKFEFPLQIQIHTDFLSPYFRKSFLNKIRIILSRFIIRNANNLRVVSSVISDSIKRFFPDIKLVPDVLPIFVDIKKIEGKLSGVDLKKKFPQFKSIILMASRLTKEKKFDIALEVIAKVRGFVPNIGLIIAGDGKEKNDIMRTVKRLGLEDNVVFLGWQNDLVSLYKTADIFFLTSEFEGYGMTLIEAGASGCPVVTTSVGIAKTNLFRNNENCFVCAVDEVVCMVDSILALVHNSEKRDLFSNRLRDSITRSAITEEEYVNRYIGLLENTLNHGRKNN